LEHDEQTLRHLLETGHPEKRQILEALIRGYIARQRAPEAETLASVWIGEWPSDWQPWFLRGIARSQLSQQLLSTPFDLAKQDFQRVLDLKPDHDLARFLLGNALVMTGQFQEALPHLE